MDRVCRALGSVGLVSKTFALSENEVLIFDKKGQRLTNWRDVRDDAVSLITLPSGEILDDFNKPMWETVHLQSRWRTNKNVFESGQIVGSQFDLHWKHKDPRTNFEYLTYVAKKGLANSTVVLFGRRKKANLAVEEVPMLGLTVETSHSKNVLIDRIVLDKKVSPTPEIYSVSNACGEADLKIWVTNFTDDFLKFDLYRHPQPGQCLVVVNAVDVGGNFTINKTNQVGGMKAQCVTVDQAEGREMILVGNATKQLHIERQRDQFVAEGNFDALSQINKGVYFFVNVVAAKESAAVDLLKGETFWKVTPSVTVKKMKAPMWNESSVFASGGGCRYFYPAPAPPPPAPTGASASAGLSDPFCLSTLSNSIEAQGGTIRGGGLFSARATPAPTPISPPRPSAPPQMPVQSNTQRFGGTFGGGQIPPRPPSVFSPVISPTAGQNVNYFLPPPPPPTPQCNLGQELFGRVECDGGGPFIGNSSSSFPSSSSWSSGLSTFKPVKKQEIAFSHGDILSESKSVVMTYGRRLEEGFVKTDVQYDYNESALMKLTLSMSPGLMIFEYHDKEILDAWGEAAKELIRDRENSLNFFAPVEFKVYGSEMCVICFEDGAAEVAKMLIAMKCGHKAMCQGCFESWASFNPHVRPTCPVCQENIVSTL